MPGNTPSDTPEVSLDQEGIRILQQKMLDLARDSLSNPDHYAQVAPLNDLAQGLAITLFSNRKNTLTLEDFTEICGSKFNGLGRKLEECFLDAVKEQENRVQERNKSPYARY